MSNMIEARKINMDTGDFEALLEKNPYLKQDLFIRGFLITDRKIDDLSKFPFYSNWKCEEHAGFYFLAHALTGMYVIERNGNVFFIMGHAYNPFTMEVDEGKILEHIAESYGTAEYIERINDITGVFALGCISDGTVEYLVDPSGMQSLCSGVVDGSFYLSSHAQLVGDLCGLQMDSFVKELINYKWYGRVMGPYLPADLTPFSELKRVVPSHMYQLKRGAISHHRFWPLRDEKTAVEDSEYQQVIKAGAEILKKNMELVAKKWNQPWISLTGGIDSTTTFAAGNGHYDRFETFSYISAEKEVPDAAAAKRISGKFGLKHHEYYIPGENSEIKDFEARRELFRHNKGYIAELYDNEARKKFFLRDNIGCDVEVKSWVSETIRGYWYKHYGRSSFPKLSPKLFRNLYKIFILNRSLAHKIDKLFAKYIADFEYEKIPEVYPPADMHYNEVTWGSWGGLNITEMKYYSDITFIYNNRRWLDLMFRIPLEKRISDQHHLDMKHYLNPELADMNIRVVNLRETKFRAFALNVIFTLNSILP